MGLRLAEAPPLFFPSAIRLTRCFGLKFEWRAELTYGGGQHTLRNHEEERWRSWLWFME